jgi:hypothetical protein
VIGFRLSAQQPPPPRRIDHQVVMRIDGVYEVDPARMQLFQQQDIPLWDTTRIVASRWDHLAWMHAHFADEVLSGEAMLAEIEAGSDEA